MGTGVGQGGQHNAYPAHPRGHSRHLRVEYRDEEGTGDDMAF